MGRKSLRCADAGEECGRGFVAAAFAAGEFGFGGNKFATESFGEDGLCQLFGANRGGGHALFDGISELE